MRLSATVAAAAAALIVGSASADVRVQQGALHGTEHGGVDEYLAIPYAQPPVGQQRWRDPLPAKSWAGVRDATKPSAACMQGTPGLYGPITAEFNTSGPVSEDCLYLNVWAPKKSTQKLPVFFWIHGGGFGSGSGTIPIYDGTDLASKGAIVVTINYRLGIFGYFAHPELTKESAAHTSGNYGLMDMVAALKWVRANISKFGGDPDNITIAGQSAGAAAVNDLILSPPAKGLFRQAIAESGSGMGLFMTSLADAETTGQQFATRVGAADLQALRAVPAQKLLDESNVPSPSAGRKSMPRISFAPNRDNVVVAADPGSPDSKPISSVPLLTGFNSDEGPLWGTDGVTAATFEADVRQRYGAFADRFLALYPHGSDDEAKLSFVTLTHDRPMASLMFWSYARMHNSNQPIYTYLYDHPYPANPDGKKYGAFHTAEVPYVFGALGLGGRDFAAKDREVSHQIQSHWLAFMRTGNPSTPAMPWPTATEQTGKVMGLGDTVGPRFGVSSFEHYQILEQYTKSGGMLSLF